MINDILSLLWIFAPAGLANMAPVLVNNISYLSKFNKPIDLKKTYRGQRILGNNKTYRGLIAGIVMAVFVISIQMILYKNFDWPKTISHGVDYGSISIIFIGFALGLGAGLGDSVESFFKRQKRIKPGDNWFPFDQIDFVTGAIILTYPFTNLSLKLYLILYVMALLLHPVINIISYLIGFQDEAF